MVKEAGMYYMEINQVYHSNRSLKLNTTSSNNFAHGYAGDLQHVEVFYFHSDHLGSSNYVSNYDGDISQHAEYLPFGELLTDEHLNSHNTRYKYNGKEFDQETGNYYYGARYYKPKTSLWLSVDPLAEQMPSWSPHNYTFNNPIRYIDPDGRAPEDIFFIRNDGTIDRIEQEGAHQFYVQNTGTTGNYISDFSLAGTLTENTNGMVEFPASGSNFGRYGKMMQEVNQVLKL
ncbi:RHS repeat domain-containing protein [Flavobacterium sp. CS20]|uniref:RHS repeat domain-containing protein n=1 Tax=Flavobacterium sp. CS20 TaxID=2775246 RepID=UPI001B3A7A3C|nr:RHS repeat-associated core domain-containing protein [Flavobacterium sp. CS20]QTY27566.1 RHS repeat-associated core domain-containing protein [Flavobacterium sp. CS20]